MLHEKSENIIGLKIIPITLINTKNKAVIINPIKTQLILYNSDIFFSII